MKTKGEVPKWAWYYHNEPDSAKEILIGPVGHDAPGWEELGPVWTPEARQANPFYMEAECCLVLRAHGLSEEFEANASGGHMGEINYAVPNVATEQPMTPGYVDEAYHALNALRKKHKMI